MKSFIYFHIFLFLCNFCIISAGWSLTLKEALALSASHPVLLESRLNIDQIVSTAEDAGKRSADSVSLESENVSGRLPGFSNAEVTLAFKRNILDRQKTKAQKRLAALSIDDAKLEFNAMKREIGSRVQAAFHRVIALQNLYQNALEMSKINLEMFEATKARVEAGASPEQEIVKAQLEIDKFEVEQKNIEGKLEEAIVNLYREAGAEPILNIEVVGTLTPDIELPEIEQLHQNIMNIHPTLLSIDQKLRENSARQKLLKAENRPSYSWVAGARNFIEEGSHAFVFAIEAELPNRIANRGARKATLIEKNKIETEKEKSHRELLSTLQEQIIRFNRSKATALRLRTQIMPSAQKSLEMSLDGYRLGKTDQLVVLESRKVYAEVARESLMALSELYEAVNAIEQLTGICLVNESH
ncbi:MAG: TolC family protein [Candidatus Riflebacteria bacterium]|nr:TolC family protein [Candidatus Riflebacteria bacterium]